MNFRESITRFITNEFLDGDENESIPDDLDLVKSGIIDSLGILRIVVFLEEELNIVIEPEQMIPKNLSSIGSILNLVNSESVAGH
jgi:acyl carrier protein